VNSRWNRGAGAVLLTALALACGGKSPAAKRVEKAEADPAQRDADLLGRELSVIVDQVMAFRSAHRGQLPASLRQAGIDSLTSTFIRRLGRQGRDPLVTIRFRSLDDRRVAGCSGTSMVLEDASLHGGQFEVNCDLADGGSRSFTILPPPPPQPK
jgi:hypothetical protein